MTGQSNRPLSEKECIRIECPTNFESVAQLVERRLQNDAPDQGGPRIGSLLLVLDVITIYRRGHLFESGLVHSFFGIFIEPKSKPTYIHVVSSSDNYREVETDARKEAEIQQLFVRGQAVLCSDTQSNLALEVVYQPVPPSNAKLYTSFIYFFVFRSRVY